MCAPCSRPLSGSEEFIQGVRFNARLELPMKPIKHMSTMATLDLTPGLANGDMALPLLLQTVALFLEEDIREHSQGPETHDGDGAHQLILIQAQFFFAIAKEDFDIPASSDVQEQGLWARFQITGSPIACLRHAVVQRLTHDHDRSEERRVGKGEALWR